MDLHTVSMALTENGFGSVIKLDGVELKGVTRVALESSVDGLTKATVELFARVEVTGDFRVEVVERFIPCVCPSCQHRTYQLQEGA